MTGARADSEEVKVERAEEPPASLGAIGAPAGPMTDLGAGAMLALQRRAGNRVARQMATRQAAIGRILAREPNPTATDGAPAPGAIVTGGAAGSRTGRWQKIIFVARQPMSAHDFRVQSLMQFYGIGRQRAEQIVDSTPDSEYFGPHNTSGVGSDEVGKMLVVSFQLPDSGTSGGESDKPPGSNEQAGSGPTGAAAERTKEFKGMQSDEQTAITAETNARFWRWADLQPGTQLTMDPSQKDARKLWMDIRDEVIREHNQLATLDPRIQKFMSPDGSPIDPADYQAALRVANKLKTFTDEDWALYKRRVTAHTTDWGVVEASIDRFVTRQRSEQAVIGRIDKQEGLYKQVKEFNGLQWYMFTPINGKTDRLPYDDPSNKARFDAAEASVKKALAAAGYKDIPDFDAACAAYLAVFRSRAVEIAMLALAAAEQVVRAERDRYQKTDEVRAEFDRLVTLRSLSAAAGEAHGRALPPEHIHAHGTVTYDPPTPANIAAAAEAKELDAKVEAERQTQAEASPILKDPKLLSAQLAGARTPEKLGEWLHYDTDERLGDISRSRAKLIDDPEVVFKYDRVLALALQELGAKDGSIGADIVADHIANIASGEVLIGFLTAALAIGLGLLTFGGGTVAVLAAAGTLALSTYQAGEAIEDYQDAAAAAHSAFDPEGTLSSQEPTPVWAALALVGVFADFGSLVGALKAAGPAVKLFEETNDAAKFEAKLVQATSLSEQVRNRLTKAALAEQEYRAAVGELGDAFKQSLGRVYSGGLDPDVLEKAAKVAAKAIKKGIRDFHVWLADLKLQRLMKGIDLDKLSVEEIEQLRRAFENRVIVADVAERMKLGPTVTNPTPPSVSFSERAAKAAQEGRILIDARTAGKGGIVSIHYNVTPTGELEVVADGWLIRSPGARKLNFPNYNTASKWGRLRRQYNLGTWEAAHLWGPGFGDEAAGGMMLAPREVNQIWQNKGIEDLLRDLRGDAAAEGGFVHVRATATSHAMDVPDGENFLKSVQYEFWIERPGAPPKSAGFVDFNVGPPPKGKVSDVHVERARSGATVPTP